LKHPEFQLEKPKNRLQNIHALGDIFMITLLESVLERADGNYVSAKDLRLLDRALSSWQARKDAYNAIQKKESEIIKQAVELMLNSDQFIAKPKDKVGLEKCQRDMKMSLRNCALFMLMQDEEMLKDRFLYWHQNILQALQVNNYEVYKHLWQAVKSQLTSDQAALLNPYLKLGHEMVSGQ
jgi:Phycobilisome protein